MRKDALLTSMVFWGSGASTALARACRRPVRRSPSPNFIYDAPGIDLAVEVPQAFLTTVKPVPLIRTDVNHERCEVSDL